MVEWTDAEVRAAHGSGSCRVRSVEPEPILDRSPAALKTEVAIQCGALYILAEHARVDVEEGNIAAQIEHAAEILAGVCTALEMPSRIRGECGGWIIDAREAEPNDSDPVPLASL